MNFARKPLLFLWFFVLVFGGVWTPAQAKPLRHPAELDLLLRAEWDGNLNQYLKELKIEQRLQADARAEQHKIRQQEEWAERKNREEFRHERLKNDRTARIRAFREAYADMLHYKQEQDRIRKEYAAERASEKRRRKETRTARVTNYKAVRLALIQYHRDINKSRNPAMLKMPKPDTTALKDGSAPDPTNNAFAPPLPQPTMDMANMQMPQAPQPIIPDPNQPMMAPPPDQSASAAPSFAPNGADTGRAFGGNAR